MYWVVSYPALKRNFALKGGVYTAGSYFDGSNIKPCYWQGTTRIDLPASG
ncbi:hypothetical protein AGMMS50230_10790 [Spirochaetia bacterium]|nr:hypothetical protein AGMMS50230_10790 [Spirochaetia bacterium]